VVVDSTGGVAVSLVRKFAVVVLTLLLTSTLVTGNLLAAVHLTVLDPTFVQNTVEEEGGYDLVENATVEVATSQVQSVETGGSTDISAIVDTESLVRDAVDQSYLENQTERNVDRLYAYLHGNSETANLTVETTPLKDDVEAAVEAQIRNATVAELLEQTDANLTALSGSSLPVTVNQTTVERMTANESGYETVKQNVHDGVREAVLDRAVQTAWEETSNDEKLYLVIPDYDPRDYSEAEKERMVADNETEIRTTLRERIERERGDEIDQGVNETLAQANETLAPDGTDQEGIAGATAELQAAFVQGLTTDMTYDEFQSELDAAKARAAVAVGDRTGAALDEQLPDRISLLPPEEASGGTGDSAQQGPRQALEQAQNAVTWLDRIAIALPILALVLVGLVYFVTRSFQTVASSLGVSLLVAGLPIYLSLGFVQSTAERQVQQLLLSGDPNQLVQAGTELLLGVLDQLFGRVGTISLAFALAGGALVAVWLLLRYDVIDFGGGGGRSAAAAAAGADADAMDADRYDGTTGVDEPDETAAAVSDESAEVFDTGGAAAVDDAGSDPLSDVTDDGDEE